MADSERNREEPKMFVYNGGQEDSHPAEPAAAGPARCPDCGGRGSIVLLITTRPCTRCGGTGVIGPAPAPAKPVRSYTYTSDATAPADPELPPLVTYSRYRYENDVLVAEERVDCAADGQWWLEKRRVVDGELRLVSREPAPPPP